MRVDRGLLDSLKDTTIYIPKIETDLRFQKKLRGAAEKEKKGSMDPKEKMYVRVSKIIDIAARIGW